MDIKKKISEILDMKLSKQKFLIGLGATTASVLLLQNVDANTWFRDDSGNMTPIDGFLKITDAYTGKKIILNGDLAGVWSRGITTWQLPFTDIGYGITITSIVVQSSDADPTTELNANIKYCDDQGTGAFPGANQTLITAIDTTTGNYSSTGRTDNIATGKHFIF